MFLNDSICTNAGGSKTKKMKLTVKGGAAVDPDSGSQENTHCKAILCGFLFVVNLD